MKKVVFAMILTGSLFFANQALAANDELIIVNKTTNKLAFYDNYQLVKVMPIATGRTEDLTPEGKFKVVNKIKNRPYYTGNIPGGDSKNPLGDRWLGLNARGTWGTTYAIHGTNNPKSIGTYASSGCIRMYTDDVHWLFDQVDQGTPVFIKSSEESFESLAQSYGYLKLAAKQQ